MRNRFPLGVVSLVLAGFLSASAARAQEPLPSTANALAPVPPAILNAKKVFISNAGADSGLFPHPFSGDPDRPYNEFYTGMKSWGRYQLVSDPSEADLVFELRLIAPNGPQNPSKQNGAADPLPMFRLVILDQKSHYILWALTESVDFAILQKTHDHNFDQALANLTSDVKRLTGVAVAANH
jgi:hypothetical protein